MDDFKLQELIYESDYPFELVDYYNMDADEFETMYGFSLLTAEQLVTDIKLTECEALENDEEYEYECED